MRLRQLQAELPVRLVHRAFILRPDAGEARQFTEYHLQHRRAARELTGLPFDLPTVGAPYPRSSLPALEAAEWVKQRHPEQFEAYDLSLFEAFFRETRDISDPAVLTDLATRLDIDPEPLRHAVETGALRDAIIAEHLETMREGVRAIPTIVIGGEAISGAVPYAEYLQAARAALDL